MITEKGFIDLIEDALAQDRVVEQLSNLGVNIFDSPIVEYGFRTLDRYLKSIFSSEIVDTIYWWLYELEDRSKPCMWDENNNVIPMNTAKDLWNHINKNYTDGCTRISQKI